MLQHENNSFIFSFRLEESTNCSRTVRELPDSFTALQECPAPSPKPIVPLHPRFGLMEEHEIPIIVSRDEFAWLFSRTFNAGRIENDEDQARVPVWSGYNSLVNKALPVTRVGAPPLVAHPPHEWNTLLTVLMQAQNISTIVVGSERKTVISLDMGLYLPSKKLQMARNDLNHLILRPGELHIVMAMLRTIGAYIDSSGIDMCWIESELYGPSTVKQILDGNHVKRGEKAHMITLQALFALYLDEFLKTLPELRQCLENLSREVIEAFKEGDKEKIERAHQCFVDGISSSKVIEKMLEFDAANNRSPLFVVMRHYMCMIMEMFAFIRSVRSGNWKLHLITLEQFTKYFFAHDRLNYSRMIPLCLAEMASLEASDPSIHQEFMNGNWVVNKNDSVSFCAVGADNALEHLNRSMKVSGGLVGITQNESARAKFFLIAPELARLSSEAKSMAGVSLHTPEQHHNLSAAIVAREDKGVRQLIAAIKSFTNPFSVSKDSASNNDLYNLVTKVVMSKEIKNDLCQQSEIGRKLFNTFVDERLKTGKVNLWSTMKKRKLKTWKSSCKVIKMKTAVKVVELKEDRSLFARLMMICKSRPEVDIKEAIALYEFSVVPRSLFAPDGTMLHCPCKSALMHILEKLTGESSSEVTRQTSSPNAEVQFKVAIVDGMAEIQSLDKPEWIKTCKHLAEHFNNRLFSKYDENQEIRLIFDRCDVPSSLKSATRTRRQGLEDPVYYRISDSTHIAKVPLKKLLSHTKTKAELTAFLAKKVKERGQVFRRQLVVAWGKECEATHKDMGHLQSDHEEADTKIILHAVDATAEGATDLTIHSPDTDVLVLAIRRSSEMCLNTSFVTGRGTSHRSIKLQPIAEALGPEKTAALPAFHAITGADNTGSLSGKGKVSCWKAFLEADDSVLNALAKLGREEEAGADIKVGIERFVCQIYLPRTDITTVKELRWFLFRKKQAELPPRQAALHQAILRAHFQLLVWNKDTEPNPVLPSPSDYGWAMENAEWVPVMTTLPPAPEAVIELVKCGCSKERCSTNRCQCRRAGLLCTDLCSCSDDSECENQNDDDQYQYDEDESDEDECNDE